MKTTPQSLRSICLLVGITAALFLSSPTAAQNSAAGSIEGRVFDSTRGQYLPGARVMVEGTLIEAFTDEAGFYRLVGVPAGTAKLRVLFTGRDSPAQSVAVTAGETTTHDISFGLNEAAAAAGEGPIKLTKFVVSTSKDMDAAAIALNEQRVAPNIKTVVTADEFGVIADGTAGEAIKFLPGITLSYSAGEAREVSINGAPSSSVPVTVNGFDLASNNGGGTGRTVNFEQFSINNIARIEVINSPTPESPGNALAGSVNMIPRSAFERSHPSFTYRYYEQMKDSDRHYRETPGPMRDTFRKVTPGFQFNAIVPVNKKFGFTFSANAATQFMPDDVISLKWRPAKDVVGGAFAVTTPDQPYLTDVTVTDDLRLNKTQSASVTFDYRLSSHDTVSFSSLYTYITVDHNARELDYFITGVSAGKFSTSFTHGDVGKGVLQLLDTNTRIWIGTTSIETLTYRHNGGMWKADGGAGYSYAGQHNRDTTYGLIRNSTARRSNVTIAYDDIFYLRPRQITVTDGTTGAAVDPYNLSNYVLSASNGTVGNFQNDNWLTFRDSVYGNLQRDFYVHEIPFSIKTGLDVRQIIRDFTGPSTVLSPVGAPNQANPAGNAYNAGQFVDDSLSQRTLPYGFGKAQWVDDGKLWQYYLQHPGYFTTDPNAIYKSRVSTSKWISETVSAGYLRGDVAFFNRRLQFVGGVRAEQTNDKGRSQLNDPMLDYQHDAKGNILHDASGKPLLIVPTNAGLAYSQLTLIERGNVVNKEYLRVLPNLNAIYNFKENLRLQSAYYYSLGRPDFNQYIGGITLPDTDLGPTTTNVISVNNAGIKAWTAKTFKMRLEYFFEGVGEFSIGGYRRDFKNFFGSAPLVPGSPEFLQLYNLDPTTYDGYYVKTNYNIPGTVRTHGIEFAYKQALTFLPHWARGVQVFANGTTQRITGDATGATNFNGSFIPYSGSWGISVRREKFKLQANWNYRSPQRRGAIASTATNGVEPGTFTYNAKRMYLDLSGEYNLSRRFGFFASMRNIDDQTEDQKVYGPSTPAIARFSQRNDYSSFWTFGVQGTF
jgi:iron complex outermembrane recepter protein